VPGYDGGQEPIIYLASYAEDVAKAGLDYVFTNKHAVLTLANFYNDLADLGSVDLALMKARYWNNTEDDPDRLERRQAEFLVKGSFPLNLVVQIGVGSKTILERVEAEIAESNYPIQVQRRQNWYY
jgi:hypothetical protein